MEPSTTTGRKGSLDNPEIREDVPVIPLYDDVLFAAARNDVKGFRPDPQFTAWFYWVSLER